jgi:hypothetical protein
MNDVATPAFGLMGFLAGTLLWTQLTRWVLLLYTVGSKHGGDYLGPPKRRLIWAAPIVGLIHPAPWLICVTVFLGVHAYRVQAGARWAWFYGGLSLAILLMIFSTAMALTRGAKLNRKAAEAGNTSCQ